MKKEFIIDNFAAKLFFWENRRNDIKRTNIKQKSHTMTNIILNYIWDISRTQHVEMTRHLHQHIRFVKGQIPVKRT